MELRNSSNKRYNYNCIQTVFRFNYIFKNIQKYPSATITAANLMEILGSGDHDKQLGAWRT